MNYHTTKSTKCFIQSKPVCECNQSNTYSAKPIQKPQKRKVKYLPQEFCKSNGIEILCLRIIVGLVVCAGGDRVETNDDMAETMAKTSSGTASTRSDNKNDVEMKGFLLKWTNYIKGYQRRWFVLSGGVLSYYRFVIIFIDFHFITHKLLCQ